METSIHELSAGYALDALDAAERLAFERHLPDCAACQDELASFWEVTGALALSSDAGAPSPLLRDRILAAARDEKQTVLPFESRRRRRLQPALAAATAVAAAVAIGLGIHALSLQRELNDAKSALAAEGRSAAVLADPTATTVALGSNDSGRLVVNRDGAAVLVMDAMPAAPAGKTYQAWIVEGQTPVSAGTFRASGGRLIVPIAERVPKGAVVAVTVEKAGGAASPTLPPIVASNPV